MDEIKNALLKLDKKNQKIKKITSIILLVLIIPQLIKMVLNIMQTGSISIVTFANLLPILIFILIIILVMNLSGKEYHKAIINNEYTLEFTECTRKYKTRSGGKNKSTHYHICGQVDGIEQNTTVPRAVFMNIEEGNTILAVKYGRGKVKLFTEYQLDEA